MKELPKIELSRISHNGFDAILLRFHYDVMLVNICKQVGARWSESQRAWYVPDDKTNRENLMRAFRDYAWLHWPVQRKFEKERKERASKMKDAALNDRQIEALSNMENLLLSLGRAPSTIESYLHLCQLLMAHLTKPDPAAINNQDVIRFQSDFLVKNGYAESTQRQFATAVKYLFRANQMPWFDISKVQAPARSKKLPKVISRPEILAILTATDNLKHRTILSLMYSTGLRVGEVINLRLKDLNFENCSMHIERSKGRKDRMVPMGRQMADMLAAYINRYRPIEFVFNGKSNMRYTQTSVRALLKRAALKAGVIKDVTPHMLRHSFATHMIEDGVNLRYVQELLGHNRPETTQIYTHVASEHLMGLKNPFDRLLEEMDRANKRIDLTNPLRITRENE